MKKTWTKTGQTSLPFVYPQATIKKRDVRPSNLRRKRKRSVEEEEKGKRGGRGKLREIATDRLGEWPQLVLRERERAHIKGRGSPHKCGHERKNAWRNKTFFTRKERKNALARAGGKKTTWINWTSKTSDEKIQSNGTQDYPYSSFQHSLSSFYYITKSHDLWKRAYHKNEHRLRGSLARVLSSRDLCSFTWTYHSMTGSSLRLHSFITYAAFIHHIRDCRS